jgi:group I intron endonuclease
MKIVTIYKYTNKLDGKVYVGQSDNLPRRHREHLRHSKKLKYISLIDRAIGKYGYEYFTLETLEQIDADFADDREAFWIEKLNSQTPNGYNIALGGHSTRGYKHTAESKKKMSEGHKRNLIVGPAHHLFGKPLPEWHKQKLSKFRTGLKLGPQSPEDRKKKSDAHLKTAAQKLLERGINFDEIKRLHSEGYLIRPLAKMFSISRKAVNNIISGKYEFAEPKV